MCIEYHTLSVLLWETMLKIRVASFISFAFELQLRLYYVYNYDLSLAVDFFNQINMLYGTITEHCTTESCPVMSAGPK